MLCFVQTKKALSRFDIALFFFVILLQRLLLSNTVLKLCGTVFCCATTLLMLTTTVELGGSAGIRTRDLRIKSRADRNDTLCSRGYLTTETVCGKVCKLQPITANTIPRLVLLAVIHLTVDARGVTRYNSP